MLYSKLFTIFFLICVIAMPGLPRPFDGGYSKRTYKGPKTPYRGGPKECYDLCYWTTLQYGWQLIRGTRRRIQQECDLCELLYRLNYEYNATIALDPRNDYLNKTRKAEKGKRRRAE